MWVGRVSDVTEDGHKVLEYLRTTRGRIAAAIVTSLVVVVFAILLDVPFPVLPGILAAVWVPAFARLEADWHGAGRWLLVLAGGLVLLAGLGVLAFVLVER